MRLGAVFARVELVAPSARPQERDFEAGCPPGWFWYDLEDLESVTVPVGKANVDCQGPKYRAVLARTDDNRGLVWLYDREGRCLGLGADYRAEGYRVLRIGWNASGTMLGIVTGIGRDPGWARSLDVVEVPSLRCRRLADLGATLDDDTFVTWVGDEVLVYGTVTRAGTLVIAEVAATTGARRELARRCLWPHYQCISLSLVPAPGGRYIAFRVLGAAEEYQLWMLDRRTGWFGQAVFDSPECSNSPEGWESEDRLLIYRTNYAERRRQLWRGYVRRTPPPGC